MGQISIRIQNRTYRLSCDDGDEVRLMELAEHVRSKADGLVDEHGRISDEHLMLMSALLVADELFDERAAKDQTGNKAATRKRTRAKPAEQVA